MTAPPDFLVVGTPRSGTTLVQRLAAELVGVRVPPETHFFALFALGLARRVRFPLVGGGLRAELVAYASLPQTVELHLDLDGLLDALDHRCRGLGHLFSALVEVLAGPGAEQRGEKTPDHLLWWRPLAAAYPALRMVAVVRDPRAVVASNLSVPFAMRGAGLLAERWARDQHQLALAGDHLGGRLLVLRYEEVVADPTGARDALSAHLGAPAPEGVAGGMGVPELALSTPREVWKANAGGAIDRDRVEAWKDSLDPGQVAEVESICRAGMRRHGYRPSARGARVPRPAATALKRAYFRLASAGQLARIGRTRL